MNPIKIILGLAAVIAIAQLGRWGWQEWQLTQPGFHETDCWFSKLVAGNTTCGFLVVRENRQVRESRTIRLPVVIFAAEPVNRWKSSPAKEPILYLTGGPGGQAYIGEQSDVDSWWLERRIFPKGRDLIVMGQRGTGLKEPDFDCEEFNSPAIVLNAHPPGSPPLAAKSQAIEAAIACAQRLQEEGVDLSAYNSRESAADIAELRLALRIEKWNLYGISYGTRLALSVLRYHPEGVRAVVLDAVFPPEATSLVDDPTFFRAALHRFLTGCIDRAPCEPPHDSLWTQYLRLHDELGQRPVEVDLSAIDPDVDLVATIDHRRLDALLLRALYSRETRQLIAPAIRGAVTRGIGQDNFGSGRHLEVPIRDLLKGTLKSRLKGSDAVRLSHVCRDEIAFLSAGQIAAAAERAGSWAHLITEDTGAYLCPVWPSGQADPIEKAPVKSDIPALLLAGILDPVTPPELARSAARHLSNHHLLEFLHTGHGVIYEVDCAGSVIAEFLDAPQQRPKGDCVRSNFLLPQ